MSKIYRIELAVPDGVLGVIEANGRPYFPHPPHPEEQQLPEPTTTVIFEGRTRADAQREAYAYVWLLTISGFRNAFLGRVEGAADYWRSANGSCRPPRAKGALRENTWPEWSELADLVCGAYQQHPSFFTDWRDWVVKEGWAE